MKARPILFSAPMVRAVLGGCKTQKRMIVKPQPTPDAARFVPWETEEGSWAAQSNSGKMFVNASWQPVVCPYGQPGDRLWVRETFWLEEPWKPGDYISYRATEQVVLGPWKPSIFMPRKASRITLEIVSVRVERLQDISEDDAKAEGVEPYAPDDGRYVEGYRELWQSINGAGSWALNPWVWRIEFKVIKP